MNFPEIETSAPEGYLFKISGIASATISVVIVVLR
jgi:hypothetical protein